MRTGSITSTVPGLILNFILSSFVLIISPSSYDNVTSLVPAFAVSRTRKTSVNRTPLDILFSENANTTLLLGVNSIIP